MNTEKDSEIVYAAKHYKSERDYVLFLPPTRGFVAEGGETPSLVAARRFSAVEANRAVTDYYNRNRQFLVKMKICPCRGINPYAATADL